MLVKAYKFIEGVNHYAGMLKYNYNLVRKVNEGKFLIYQAFIRASGNADAFKKFTHEACRVNFNENLKLFAYIINKKSQLIIDDVKAILYLVLLF